MKNNTYLILIIALVLPAFQGSAVKNYAVNVPTSLTFSTPIGNEPMSKNCKPAGDRLYPVATDIIFQSNDNGETWQDISAGLPENEQPEGFFAGESDIYIRIQNEMYRSKSNLAIPVWEKENVLDPEFNSITFSRSGAIAYNTKGNIYRRMSQDTWTPVYENFKNQWVRTIFESYDGTVFVGCDNGLYRSADNGRSWKQVVDGGWVMELVESEGVLLASSQHGIIRSTDNGKHWELVISDGGVGIAVERINGGFAAITCCSGTMSRLIRISLDRGKTWNVIGEELRPSLSVSSIKQVGRYLICGHPDGIFRSSDMGKTWTLVHSSLDYFFIGKPRARGFQIYVSGDVVYAVVRGEGC